MAEHLLDFLSFGMVGAEEEAEVLQQRCDDLPRLSVIPFGGQGIASVYGEST
ncbi:hypothetical protein ACFHYQ_10230 [Sphaerimonospora cavernae]|uniref:Uncharacterized protein n=1 Tax=Sphaerimonospora cavernae TaxID=1740611 RepID=A0ABV6U2I4_9ACTN